MHTAKPPAPMAHHLLKFVFQEAEIQQIPLERLAERAGICYKTLQRAMRGKANITLATMEALLEPLGYTTKPTMLRRDAK